MRSKTDFARLDAIQDKDINDSDIPELTDDAFTRGELKLPKTKASVTMRLDRDVLNWFKDQGPRYQTRINVVLRRYMNANDRHAHK